MGAVGPDVFPGGLVLLGSAGGTLAVIGGALALGIRHGIDWDHIAAITDITSGSAVPASSGAAALVNEPAVMLGRDRHGVTVSTAAVALGSAALAEAPLGRADSGRYRGGVRRYFEVQRRPFILGTLYAVGHGAVVTLLGLLAIVASGFLPGWIDPIMGRVVGATLIVLALYLYYSLYRYFRGGQFELRSRWMLVFAGARRVYRLLVARVRRRVPHEHQHAPSPQYGARAAFGIGLIHGVGAETGTQALVIATAVGAASKAAGIVALLAFVVGLLIANSFITIATTAGFLSTQRRQQVYVGAGVLAAVFSTVLGLVFLFGADGALPDLGGLFRWVGGSD